MGVIEQEQNNDLTTSASCTEWREESESLARPRGRGGCGLRKEGTIVTNRSWILAAAAASALALGTPGLRAQTAPAPSTDSTSEEIKALRQRLDQLEAQQKEADQKRQEAETKLEEQI